MIYYMHDTISIYLLAIRYSVYNMLYIIYVIRLDVVKIMILDFLHFIASISVKLINKYPAYY